MHTTQALMLQVGGMKMFCTYLELYMDIDVVICCVKLVTIVFEFCTCELLDVKLVAIVLIFHVNT